MLGLLRKDLFNLSSQLKIYLFFPLMAIGMCIWQKDFAFTQVMISIVILFIPLSAFAYDEMSDFYTYAMTLPITKKQIVSSKYILSILLAIAVILIASLIGVVISLLPLDLHIENWEEFLATIILVSLVMNLLNCVMLPLMFRFGTEKARVLLMILFFAIGGIGYLLNTQGILTIDALRFLDSVRPFSLCIGFVIISIVLEWISMQVSNQILKKKEF